MAKLYAVETSRVVQEKVEIPPHEQEMLDLINMVERDQHNQEMGLTLGPRFKQFEEAFNGIRSALYFIAAQPNVGKTALSVGMCNEIIKHNEKVYAIYFALDDRAQEIMPRFIAWNQRIPMEAIQFPKKFRDQPNILKRRDDGYNELRSLVSKFKLRDVTFGDSVEYIEDSIREHKNSLPDDVKLVAFIDNFYDLNSTEKTFASQNDKYQYIGTELDRIINTYDTPIICTAELRKLNGTRRPVPEDLRETVKLVYKAKAICLCYNEVGLKGESANIYWDRQGTMEKQPVLEVKIGKNKLGSFKGTLFYNFYPEQSYLDEVPPQGRMRYAAMID